MPSSFLPQLSRHTLEAALQNKDETVLYELLVEPLHEALYKENDFAFMNRLSDGQQLLLSFDYVRNQVGQGGFIQLLVNGYAPLLLNMPQWLGSTGADEMAQVIDDALKVYVLNINYFKPDISVEDFGKLYEELKEFEAIDKRYEALCPDTIHKIAQYITGHLSEYCQIADE